ncbi:hypothetical protein AAFF_G00344930 [Aldrovandia affinis]|uniref:C-type lectin domain-containing protein n=1 Tax=Aldrovandia affinis TaxID=143900 RepID=A0AAD7W066_9TELE|nr:hypothetical protein AAFF_G00344930 [Aldrovandia affinis]
MAVQNSTVSTVSEGIYMGLDSPDQDVYNTVGQTSHNSPGAQNTEGIYMGLDSPDQDVYNTVGQTSHNSPGAQNTVLGVLYTIASQNKDQLPRVYDALVVKFPILDQYCPLRSQKRVCRPCPEGWELSNSKCYYFSTEFKNWNDSRSDCLKQGADLVIIESKEEQDFISKHRRDDFYWIGLSDSETEGTFLWVDGTPLQEDKAFWGRGQPDDNGPQDCAATLPAQSEWFDVRCSSNLMSVCQTDALPL